MATQAQLEDLSVDQFYAELARKGINIHEVVKDNPELIEELEASKNRLQTKAEVFNKNREEKRQRVEAIKKKWRQNT